MGNKLFLLYLLLGAAFPKAASAQDSAEVMLSNALSALHIGRSDLDIRPSRWETRLTLPKIEALMSDPLSIPNAAEEWSDQLEQSQNLSDLIKLWGGIRDVPLELQPVVQSTQPAMHGLPPDAAAAIRRILAAIRKAQGPLQRAVRSLPAKTRADVLSTVQASIFSDPAKHLDSAVFDDAAKFNDKELLNAALLLTRGVEESLPALMRASRQMKEFPRKRFHFQAGDVLVSGSGNDVYSADDLKDAVLLVDFGGSNRYEGPVAAAGTDQIRVAIDLGADVTVEASTAPAAGSGILGIGLFYLPNPRGTKMVDAGDFSQGAGLFGAGGLYVRGEDIRLSGARFTQGAGAFGIGLLQSESFAATLSARLAGQGFGFIRGAGIFYHKGDRARLSCGLYYPDSHEPAAALSLCQGMGDGPRAFAAGGVGLAMIRGNNDSLEASYNAQGSGYWHGFGGLFLYGSGNKLTGRRYGQGSGVHTAVGVLRIRGDRNETANWGVGPAFGWDRGIGLLTVDGDENSLGAQWASGKGDVNGHGLAVIRGNKNLLSLVDFGSGIYKRNGASYGIAVASGTGNRFRTSALPAEMRGTLQWRPTPWGAFFGNGEIVFDPALKSLSHQWAEIDRTEAAKKEHEVLMARLQAAQSLPPPRRFSEFLEIATSGGLEGDAPFQALKELFVATAEDLPALLKLLDSDHFDELIWLRPLVASFGVHAKPALLQEVASAQGIRKVLLLGLLRHEPVTEALDAVLPALSDPDWRVRGDAAGVLGYLLDQTQGSESGRLRLIAEMLALAKAGELPKAGDPAEKQMLGRIGMKALTDVFGLIALDPALSNDEKWDVFQKDPNPADSVNPAILRAAGELIIRHKDRYLPLLQRELDDAQQNEGRVRAALRDRLSDPDVKVRNIGALALGQIGNKDDAEAIAALMGADDAKDRESAAMALAKMGAAAKDILDARLKSDRTLIRAVAAEAVAQSTDAGVLTLLHRTFEDPDEEVRLSGVAAFSQIQGPLNDKKKDFRDDLSRLAKTDKSPSVRANALSCLGQAPN